MQHSCSRIYRSSCSQVFFKISVVKNFTIFTEKHLCWCLFLIKLQAWRPTTLSKRDSNTGVFLWILRTAFFIEHLWWLFLDFLQNFLKTTVKKIISAVEFFPEISEKLFLSLSCCVSKNNYFTGYSQSLSFFKTCQRCI